MMLSTFNSCITPIWLLGKNDYPSNQDFDIELDQIKGELYVFFVIVFNF